VQLRHVAGEFIIGGPHNAEEIGYPGHRIVPVLVPILGGTIESIVITFLRLLDKPFERDVARPKILAPSPSARPTRLCRNTARQASSC
jgi:hypothetical protein